MREEKRREGRGWGDRRRRMRGICGEGKRMEEEEERRGELRTGGRGGERIRTNDGYEEGGDAGKRKSRGDRMIGESGGGGRGG